MSDEVWAITDYIQNGLLTNSNYLFMIFDNVNEELFISATTPEVVLLGALKVISSKPFLSSKRRPNDDKAEDAKGIGFKKCSKFLSDLTGSSSFESIDLSSRLNFCNPG